LPKTYCVVGRSFVKQNSVMSCMGDSKRSALYSKAKA
jgi:hypothetical protein